jgi:argininosuccinate lyase
MPQKRNPVALYTLRTRASESVGAAEAFLIMSHNVDSDMPDYKRGQLSSPAHTLELAKEPLISCRGC